MDDPLLAAHHFAGLLLWLPLNKAMLTGSPQHTETDKNNAPGSIAPMRATDAPGAVSPAKSI